MSDTQQAVPVIEGRDTELAVIRSVLTAFQRLDDPHAARRVLDYVAQRVGIERRQAPALPLGSGHETASPEPLFQFYRGIGTEALER